MRENGKMFLRLIDIYQDIINYKNAVFMHSNVANELATGKDFSHEVKHIAGDLIDEIMITTEKRSINPQMN